ncbi:MAG TPA: C1 family peptidase [Amaricoccus sp.]|nr:C1 family peptidase [Amaricoccus sp.]
MPDDTRAHPAARRQSRPVSILPEPAVGGIVNDPIDVRDRPYEPTLAPLAPHLWPDPRVLAALRDPASPWGLPRSQGDEGTCGGQALGALIDLQRIAAEVAEPYPVSARMLYQTARLKRDVGGEEGVSLRDVIKGFYNYGVCRDALWPYRAGDEPGQLSIERARDAKNLSLGAYYRLRPNLNTYHAALHETGAILVSAELHDGWRHDRVREAAGTIVAPRPGQARGALGAERHAFVVLGYTPEGFLVLNSWGRDWGGLIPPATTPPAVTPGEAATEAAPPTPVPGLALWRYDDWADTIMDGWVLRLGVGAAEAFEFSIGDQGLGFGAEGAAAASPRVRSTPVHAILGNFLHLDDGDFVASGAFVSTRRTLDETRRLLEEDAASPKPYRGVLLTFAGGLAGLSDAADHVARWKRSVKDAGWYPFSILWCVDYVEQAQSVLDGVFRDAGKRAGAPGPRLDRVIEELAHGIGRALWRDIGRAAERAARPGGPLHDLAYAGAGLLATRPDFSLRIVTESEGAIALAALLRAMRTEPFSAEAGPFFEMLESVDLVAPPLEVGEFFALAADLDAGWSAARPDRRLRVHLPDARDEKRLAVPPYGLSYFELVRRAFVGRPDALPPDLAPARPKAGVGPCWDVWGRAPRAELVPIRWPRGKAPAGQGPISQPDLVYRSDVDRRLKGVLRRRQPTRLSRAS